MAEEVLKIPISSPVYRNVDKTELSDDNFRLVNAYLDEKEATVIFPGFGNVISVERSGVLQASRVTGRYWWKSKSQLIITCAGRVFVYQYSTTTNLWTGKEISSTPVLDTDNIVSFAVATDAAFTETLFMANGGKMYTYDGNYTTPTFAAIADVDAPTTVGSVAYIDGYILASEDNSNRVWWCSVNTPTTWLSTAYASAASNPDFLVAVLVRKREIYLMGQDTVEVWENDGENPFSRINGRTLEYGCIAKDSVIMREEGVYWLGSDRQVLKFDGNEVTTISTPYDLEIGDRSDVSDCIGGQLQIDGKKFLTFNFPEWKTLYYNLTANSWSEGGYYNNNDAVYEYLPIHGYIYIPSLGFTLCCDLENGYVYRIARTHTDYNGENIRLSRITGIIDYGTDNKKISKEITIRAKRGFDASEAKLLVRWNNNEKGWSSWREFDLKGPGNKHVKLRRTRNGCFNTRQYEFVVTSGVGAIFLDAKERVEVCLR